MSYVFGLSSDGASNASAIHGNAMAHSVRCFKDVPLNIPLTGTVSVVVET